MPEENEYHQLRGQLRHKEINESKALVLSLIILITNSITQLAFVVASINE